jgi:hypothetical protein
MLKKHLVALVGLLLLLSILGGVGAGEVGTDAKVKKATLLFITPLVAPPCV